MLHTHIYIYIHTLTYVTHTYIYIHTYINICYTHIYIYIYIYTYIHTLTYVTHTYTYIYIWYIYICYINTRDMDVGSIASTVAQGPGGR